MIFVGLKFEFAGGDAMAGCLYHTKQDRPAIFCSTGLAYVRDEVLLVFRILMGLVGGCPARPHHRKRHPAAARQPLPVT